MTQWFKDDDPDGYSDDPDKCQCPECTQGREVADLQKRVDSAVKSIMGIIDPPPMPETARTMNTYGRAGAPMVEQAWRSHALGLLEKLAPEKVEAAKDIMKSNEYRPVVWVLTED